MTIYNLQPSPPVGAFQQDVSAIQAARNPILRAGGVVDASGRSHSTFDPNQARLIAGRGSDLSVLQVRQQVQGREL